MKRISLILASLVLIAGCNGVKVSKSMLKMALANTDKVSTDPAYADSLEKKIAVPYVVDGTPSQVMDIYYADASIRKNATLIDIHGGFYVAGKRQNNRRFASVFLKAGYDVVLLEYRLNDGELDVSDELKDCAAALDYLARNAAGLGLDKDRMFLTGDSAGGHLALYMAEGASDPGVPVRAEEFRPRGVLLNCPAYDFASFAHGNGFTKDALAWFLGPRYEDKEWMESMSPRTYIGSYPGPLFVSTCTNDFLRSQSLMIKSDRDAAGLQVELLDIESANRNVAHVHNVINPGLPESQKVNGGMIAFMDRILD